MLTVIEAKRCQPPRFTRKQKLGNGVTGMGVDAQALFDSAFDVGKRVLLKKTQDADILPGTFSVLLVFQASAQYRKTSRQLPALQRASMVKSPGLAFQ